MKCGRCNDLSRNCKALSKAKILLFLSNLNWESVHKKRKFDKGHLKITDLSSEEEI